jgi:quercetin dioxygenase-like cupin family protein
MATFSVEPGKVHEHSHNFAARTVLLAGSADLVVGGKKQRLEIGASVTIPPMVSHTVINTGPLDVTVACRSADS